MNGRIHLPVSLYASRRGFAAMITKATPEPGLFEEGAIKLANETIRRFVVGENDEFRSGYCKMIRSDDHGENKSMLKPMWMDEFYVGLEGKGRIIARAQPNYEELKTFEVNPGECLFMGKGTMRSIQALTDKWIFFFIAIPASSKGLGYKVFPSGMYDERDKQRDMSA
jgi:mannose-6-phosphate isomerase-like protein (cupin superfamily)